MARQYQYAPRGGYGGGYQSNFRFDSNQPAAFQYQSFFDPVPLDFLQQEGNRRQNRYDVGYAGALAAQDELAQSMVGMQDIAAKNQILNESIGDMNSTVKDKYNGDWGLAAKDIAAQVTQVRSNPFWNAAKEADRQRKAAEEMKIKYGPNAFIFNDPTKIGVMNEETGKLRGFEEFTPDIVQKGDWVKTARELMSGLTADEYEQFGLAQGELQGFIEGKKVSAITRKKIEAMASDPAIQQAFLSRHSEIRRGVSELDQSQQQQHGLFGKSAEDVAYESLLGAGASAQYQSIDRTVQQNPYDVLNYKNRLAGGDNTGYSASATRQSFETSSDKALSEHQKRMKPANLPTADELPGPFSLLKPNEIPGNEDAQFSTPKDRETYLDAYHKELGETHPQLLEMPRDEAFQVYENWVTNQSEQSTLAWNMKLQDSAENIKSNLVSNLNQADFEINGVTATGDVMGRKNIAEAAGYKNWQEFVGSFKAGDIEMVPKIDFLNGSLALTIAGNPDKPRKSQPVTLNFQTDQQTRNMIKTGHELTKMMYDSKSYNGKDIKEVPLLNRDGKKTGIGLSIQGNADMRSGQNDKMVVVTDYNTDPPDVKTISLDAAQEMIAETIDVRYNNFQGKLGNPGKLD